MLRIVLIIGILISLCQASYADLIQLGSDNKQAYFVVSDTIKGAYGTDIYARILTKPHVNQGKINGISVEYNAYDIIVSCSQAQYLILNVYKLNNNGMVIQAYRNVLDRPHTMSTSYPVRKLQGYCVK